MGGGEGERLSDSDLYTKFRERQGWVRGNIIICICISDACLTEVYRPDRRGKMLVLEKENTSNMPLHKEYTGQ